MAIKIQVGPKKEKMKKEKKIFMRKSFLFVAKHGTIVPLLLFILTEPGVPVHFQCRSQMKTVLSYGPRLLIWTLFTQTKAALNKFRCSIATLGALSFKSIIHLHTHLRPFKSLPLLCTCHCKHDSSFDCGNPTVLYPSSLKK